MNDLQRRAGGGSGAVRFFGGTVRTASGEPDTDELLVVDGRVAAGSPIPTDAVEIDLRGGLLLPAFGDGHAHPLLAGRETFGPALRDARTVDELVSRVRTWARESDEPWLIGGSYDATIVPEGLFDARWLDDAERERPVVLHAWDYHTAWVNTAALRAAGIDARREDPLGGRIVRRDDGTVMGTLVERPAIDLVLDHAPRPRLARDVDALAWASERLAANGIAWVQEAWAESADTDAWIAAAHSGRLEVDVDLAFRADPTRWPAQLDEILADAQRVENTPGLTARTIKFFVDGIIENHTAHMLHDYHDACSRGLPNWREHDLAEAVREADAAGFNVHLHAIGDAAVRSALKAIAARGASDHRATLAHVQVIDEADLTRLADLDITLCFQPAWAVADDVMTQLTLPRLGPERELQYRMRTTLDSGARLSFGSDWPVSPPDVLRAVQTAVTRQDPGGNPREGWQPAERLTIDEALDAATAGVAYQSGQERHRGDLRPGALADLVWLDRDIRIGRPDQIVNAAVLGTWRRGIRTYSPDIVHPG